MLSKLVNKASTWFLVNTPNICAINNNIIIIIIIIFWILLLTNLKNYFASILLILEPCLDTDFN